jgi:hypothetical protein
MTLQPFADAPILGLLASTFPVSGAAGFALQNATPNILTWTAPNDGQMHRVVVISEMNVTSAQTGGEVNLSFNEPDGTLRSRLLYSGGLAAGFVQPSGNTPTLTLVAPGSVVILLQATAQTAGTAVLWAELWGS